MLDAPPLGGLSATDFLSIEADIARHDHVAAAMERKWGVGRLPLLVDAEWRDRFVTQRRRLNDAVWRGDVANARQEAAAMERGWIKLDELATAAGHLPLDPVVWETITPDGEVVAIVRTNAEAAAVTRDGRAMQVWTLAEIGKVIGHYAETAGAVKAHFPGAVVEDISIKVRPVAAEGELDGIEAALSSAVPF